MSGAVRVAAHSNMTLRHLVVQMGTTLRVQCSSSSIHLGSSSLGLRFMSTGSKRAIEARWRDLFSNTSEWWDHRPEKINPRFPDFKHKHTGDSLWVADARNPSWVQPELAAIPPGTLESNGSFAWAQRLKRYVKAGQYVKTMEVFHQMQQERICPNPRAFLPVLNACAGLGALEEGKRVHTQIVQLGHDSDVYVANCLVDMYAKCGSIEDAWSVFSKMQEHNVVSWNAMIGCYVKSGQGMKAVELFHQMQQKGVEADPVTFVGVLNACTSVLALEEGRRVHEQINQGGCISDVHVSTCLIDMYAKCGSIQDAWNVFNDMREHDVVAWNAMIGGYVKAGQWPKAIELFRKMQLVGMEPDAFTFVGVLNACAGEVVLEEGRHVHEEIVQRGFVSNIYVATSLVDMYVKCGSIKDAWSVFSKMRKHGVVSWNAMIGGYAKSGQGLKALELFRNMQLEGVEPDSITFVGVLNACTTVLALEEGRYVHEQIIHRGYESDVYVGNCLVDMYAKCGSIEEAQRTFDMMPTQNVVAWTALIGGYAMHGHTEKAIGLFGQMCKQDVEINGMTLVCLLSACSHGGLVKKGLRYFKSMTSCFNIFPTTEHYACMVDLLGRAGRLDEAEGIIKRMSVKGNLCVWMSLLGACRTYGNMEMAERVAKQCIELDPENDSGHVLLSNIYAAAGKWDRSAAIREEGLERKSLKEPGRTCIEMNNLVHSL